MSDLWPNLFVVLLPAEDVLDTELYGPFHSVDAARSHADRWNSNHPDPQDHAMVLPLRRIADLDDAS